MKTTTIQLAYQISHHEEQELPQGHVVVLPHKQQYYAARRKTTVTNADQQYKKPITKRK